MRSLLGLSLLLQLVMLPPPEASADVVSHQPHVSDMVADWQAAGRFMGLDPAQGVASLLSASLAQGNDKQDADLQQSTSLFHGFFRLLGFDTSKLNAIAVNAVVFIAKMHQNLADKQQCNYKNKTMQHKNKIEMIGSSLIKNFTGASTERSLGREDDVEESSALSSILYEVKNQARSVLSRAQDGALPDQLITALQDVPGDTDCVQLLVCRASPLLRGMQRSLRHLLSDAPQPQAWASLSPLRRMYHYLPARAEFLEAASSCSRRLPSCSQLFAGFDK